MNTQVTSGHFQITSGEVFLTDPCYDCETITREKHPGGIKTPAKNGKWIASLDIKDERDWGMRVEALHAVHEDYAHSYSIFEQCLPGTVGVDSGQAGIFDSSKYPEGASTGEYDDRDSFYGKVCTLTYDTNNPDVHGGVVDFGCVSSSGFGDGGYDAYAGKNSDGEVVSLKIVFIEDESEEDYDDEYDDDYEDE